MVLNEATTTPIIFAKSYNSPGLVKSTDHDTIYGLLYTWYSAVGIPEQSSSLPVPAVNGHVQGICPCGWHIPTQAELNTLKLYPAEDLKSTGYWLVPGTNATGFDSRPSGKYDGNIDRFVDLYGYTSYWAWDVADGSSNGHTFIISYFCNEVTEGVLYKSDGVSVRCVWDGVDCP
jgi:uncharacterized protein (TIGR02145 family)